MIADHVEQVVDRLPPLHAVGHLLQPGLLDQLGDGLRQRMITELAKITGMTPAVLTRSGR